MPIGLLEQHVKAARPQMRVIDRDVMLMSLRDYVAEKTGAKA